MTEIKKRRYSMFPKTLGACVEPVTKPLLKTQGLAGSRILTHWNDIVGPMLARRSYPEKLSFPPGKKSGATLTISVESGFALELQHMQHIILERLAGYFGYPAVARIVISHSRAPAQAQEKKHTVTKTLPSGCHALADEIDDPELKEALQSLAHTLSKEPT